MLVRHWNDWAGSVPVLSWMPWKMLLMLALFPGLDTVLPVTVVAMLPVSVAMPELPEASSMPRFFYWRIWLLGSATELLAPAVPPVAFNWMPSPSSEPELA